MSKKVDIKTTITHIIKDGYIKPTAPIWYIVNQGYSIAYLNDSYYLAPGSRFGLSAPAIAAKMGLKGMAVESEIQIKITFEMIGLLASNCILVETFPKF